MTTQVQVLSEQDRIEHCLAAWKLAHARGRTAEENQAATALAALLRTTPTPDEDD